MDFIILQPGRHVAREASSVHLSSPSPSSFLAELNCLGSEIPFLGLIPPEIVLVFWQNELTLS